MFLEPSLPGGCSLFCEVTFPFICLKCNRIAFQRVSFPLAHLFPLWNSEKGSEQRSKGKKTPLGMTETQPHCWAWSHLPEWTGLHHVHKVTSSLGNGWLQEEAHGNRDAWGKHSKHRKILSLFSFYWELKNRNSKKIISGQGWLKLKILVRWTYFIWMVMTLCNSSCLGIINKLLSKIYKSIKHSKSYRMCVTSVTFKIVPPI